MQEYDFQRLQRLLKDFYNLTQIKICLYDSNENEVCYYPEKYTGFCEWLRKDEKLNDLCKKCDKLAFAECKKTKKQYSYTCHAGLLECISPILHNDRIIGYIVIGQIRQKDCSLPFSPELVDLYEKLPALPMEKIQSAIHVLEACTGYEYLKKLDIENRRLEDKLNDYIKQNLTEDLSVQALCDQFKMSRVELYDTFKVSFNSTVAEFVKKCRLERALELLRDTNLPINEIAEKCGIFDYNYFSKVFNKTFHTTPRAYRKSSKTKNPY